MFHFFIGFIHIVICLALIFFVLIQNNKGMGLAGAFGSAGASDSVFGSSGGLNILVKITIGLSIIFACTSLALSFVPPSNPQGGIMADPNMQAGGSSASLNELMSGQATVEEPATGSAPAPGASAPGSSAPGVGANQNAIQPAPDAAIPNTDPETGQTP